MSLYWKQMKKKEDLWGSGSYIIILKHKLGSSDRDMWEEQLPWLWLERNCDQKYLFDKVALLVSQTMIEKSLRIQTGLNLNKFFCTAGSWKTLEFSCPAGQEWDLMKKQNTVSNNLGSRSLRPQVLVVTLLFSSGVTLDRDKTVFIL